jgi:glycosyltransferase involved in cell wall biosynthesis
MRDRSGRRLPSSRPAGAFVVQSLNVLWLSHLVPYPPKAGVLLRSYHLVRETALRNQLDLVAFTQRNLLAPIYEDVDAGLDEARAALGEYCRSVEFVPLPSDAHARGREWMALRSLVAGRAYNEIWATSTSYRRRVEEALERHRYDAVHFDTISLMQYADLVPAGVATVLDHHNIESHMLVRRAENEENPLKRRYFMLEAKRVQQLEREWCPRVDLNIVCSDVDGERLEEIAPGSTVRTVPNGVDVDFFNAPAGGERAPRIIFVGTLDWYPNTAAVRYIAHEIWPRLRERLPDVECDIIGGSPPQDLVELAGRDDRFHVHGFVDDIHPWMEQALAYLCPIRDGGGTKLKILDALAMSKAIVAHPIACEGIDVTPGLDVVFAESVDEYVEAVVRLREDAPLRAGLERNARRLAVDRYAFSSIGDSFQEMLTGLGAPEADAGASQARP